MEDIIFNVSDFWDRVKKLCKNNGTTQKELSAKIGLEPRIIESQIYTKVIPSIEEVLKIASVFNVSLNYLVMGKEIKSTETENLIKEVSAILEKYKQR